MSNRGDKKRTRRTTPELENRFLSGPQFARLGNQIMNRSSSGSQSAFESRWQQHFNAEPDVCLEVWNRLEVEDHWESGPDDRSAEPQHLLWALLFLKTYATESVLAGMCGGVDEDTFSTWAWRFIEKISYLDSEVVRQAICFGPVCNFGLIPAFSHIHHTPLHLMSVDYEDFV